MSTDLYKDALAEAKKLRQIAEEDAKKSIAEEIAPYIRKVISEQIGGSSSNFFIEQDDEEEVPLAPDAAPPAAPDLAGAEPGGETAADPAVTDPTGLDDLGAGLGDEPEAAPVAANGEDILSATMPDEEGKITVDFEDLFSDVEPEVGDMPATAGLDLGEPEEAGIEATPMDDVAPVEDPMAAPEGGEMPVPEEEPLPVESANYQKFEKSLHEISEKIDRAFFAGSANELVQESLKNRLFSLLEQHDVLKESGQVPGKKAKSNENKLEFLFLKLKEANSSNSYIEKDQRDDSMTSLKEYAAKLFEEDSTYAEDGDREGTNQPTTADGKHAADVSGVDPNLGQNGPEDLEGREEDGNPGGINEEMLPGTAGSVDHEPLPNTDPEPGAEEQWAKGEPSLDEEDQDKVIEEALSSLDEEIEAEGHAGFGDTDEDPAVEFEVDDKEIAEAVRDIRKKSIQEKVEALKEASDGSDSTESWEDAEPEGDADPSHENLKESKDTDSDELNEMYMEDDMEGADADDMGMDMHGDDGDDMGMDDADGDLVLHIDLPDEVEDALASVDVADMGDVEVELADVNLGGEGDDLAPDMGADAAVADVVGDEPAADVVMHDDMDDMDDEMEEGYMKTEDYEAEKAVYEAKLKKAGKLYKGLKEQNEQLKADLKEANLFLAKNVYFTKFLQRGDLSKKNLTKIVEYLDGAKTVKEAKTVYGKIKAKLHESADASKKLAGSAAQVTTPGSATTLNESANRKSSENGPSQTVSRWQHLAGVRRKES